MLSTEVFVKIRLSSTQTAQNVRNKFTYIRVCILLFACLSDAFYGRMGYLMAPVCWTACQKNCH